MQLGFLPPLGSLEHVAFCDDAERSVVRALRWGRENARQIVELADDTLLPQRRVQELVEHLIREHQVPIGTSMSAPFGNYLIQDADDLERTVELLRTRGISSLARAAALRRMSLRRYLELVQTELPVGGER